MLIRRRDVVLGAGAAALATALPFGAPFAAERSRKLGILVLGGTRFVGPHFIELAMAHGHTVTIFNRGRTNLGRVQGVEVLTGDRDDQLDALKGRKWDAVLDTSGYVPRHVRLSAQLLAPNVGHYLFVSSISVYAGFAQANDESSPLGKIADETVEKVDGETYGPLKALCEQAAEQAMPGRVTQLRPGLIVGPDDNTDRFTYWPARFKRGGDVLAPNSPADPIQIVDVRDLSAFALRCIEQSTMGVFNLVSAPRQYTIGNLLEECQKAAATDAKPVWVPAAFLAEHKVAGWSDMPVWAHAVDDFAGFAQTSTQRALAAGLSIRPLADTVRDTLAWHLSRPAEQQANLKAGISPEREREVLAAWEKKS